MGIFGNLLGGSSQPAPYVTVSTYGTSGGGGGLGAQNAYGNPYQTTGVPNPQPQPETEIHIQTVRNGFVLTANANRDGLCTRYIATNIDELCDTLKLALVEKRMGV